MSPTLSSTQFPVLARLLSANAQWADDVARAEPGFFDAGAKGQAPKVLWIGCADSRVPESVVTACRPGEIFVHRNIANQFHLDDVNAQAVLCYAVVHLGVEHVVITGHTKCGGAAACLAAQDNLAVPAHGLAAPLNKWLAPLVQIASSMKVPAGADPSVILTEESVRQQVANVCATETIRDEWAKGRAVYVHGWVYELEHGTLRDLGVSRGPE
ncbi:carbonic anhydrase [Neolentinus lepideus HHB14362 ss-1]|uniref:Carbonic anhydrase n=1 Tax=Neolentinus lepideus HHB14362 ss-1 TaxID=1314782 RepID=A0A165MLZ9_9AGAM|nr:carbonic anhydrase [Neolentinus lepideus HHB14362 ss-1]